METLTATERRQIEIELLQAMYPEQIRYDAKTGEFKYNSSTGAHMTLRLPDHYPDSGLPDLIAVVDQGQDDIRHQMNAAIEDMRLLQGEEILDAMVQGFEEVLASRSQVEQAGASSTAMELDAVAPPRFKTVVVWLHHLLNTGKRKLALSPTVAAAEGGPAVAGITKPGYPGILLYSGPLELVDAHVDELRRQRWQAFQVRYDEVHGEEQVWRFGHGRGVVEVESMADVVQGIVEQSNREAFLRAAGVK